MKTLENISQNKFIVRNDNNNFNKFIFNLIKILSSTLLFLLVTLDTRNVIKNIMKYDTF